MDDRIEQIVRIAHYETLFDRVSSAAERLYDSVDEFTRLSGDIEALSAYYSGPDWKKDFEDDEAGLIPKTLKRGVLSEDGLYDLFDEIRELRCRLAEAGVGGGGENEPQAGE